MRFRLVTSIATAGALVVLTACSSDDDGASADNGGSGGATELNVAALEIADYAPAFYALDNGLFEDEGLDVTITPIQGGADSVPLLASGEAQIAVTGWTSYVQAVGEGLPIRAVLPGAEGTEDFSGIVALPASGITSPSDLEGTTVAVNNLRAVAELTARVGLEEAGVDPDSVSFVELPFPDMGASLASGNIDAAWVVEPFLTGVTAAGAELIVDVYAGQLNGLPLGGWSSTEEFASANPDTLDAFARAMSKAVEALAEGATFVEFLPTYTALTPEQASSVTLPAFELEMSAEELQEEADLMAEYGLTDEPVDVEPTLEYLRSLD